MSTVLRIGELVINLDRRAVEVKNQPLHLTGMEYAIIEILGLRRGATVTRDMLLDHLYGDRDQSKINSLRVLISNLRKKIARASGGDRYIRTLGHRGYVLQAPRDGLASESSRSL